MNSNNMTDPTSDKQPQPSGGKELPAGTRIEEFMIEKVLGSGGFGITYLARDTSLNRQVVIKENLPSQFAHRDTTSLTIRPGPGREDQDNFRWSLENFSREAETLASLRHPGIVPVLRRFEAFGTAYFVMPFVEGITLDVLIEDRRAKGKQFPEEELRGLLERLLDALAHLHDRGIYHRDIKPGNILISNEGIPTLIDFGSARQRLSERSLTVIESPGYTPFEQLQSRGNVGPWSDLYALGGTLVKVITGEAPPKATDRAFHDPWKPLAEREELCAIYSAPFLAGIDCALSMRIENRWKDAGEWLAALRGNATVAMPPPVSARTERPPVISSNPGRRINRVPWIVAACVVLALGAWAMISLSSRKSEALPVTVVDDAALQRERNKTEAATAQAKDAEQRAARAEQEKQALTAQAKAKEEAKVVKATKDQPFVNSLGMKFVPAGTPGVLCCVWLTRVKDFAAFVDATGYDAIKDGPNGAPAFSLEKEGNGATWKQVGATWKDPRFPVGHGQSELHPVVCVSYLDAEAFCAWLTKRDADQLPEGWRYRLPTDGEWSAACGSAEFPWGDHFPPGGRDGNYSGTETMIGPLQGLSDEFSKAGRTDGWARTAPVGSYTPNRYGLFDMGGNAWEWCASWYKASMNTAETLEAIPALKDDGGGQSARVLRGGSWYNFVRVNLRSAYRYLGDPRNRIGLHGFRVVLVGGGG